MKPTQIVESFITKGQILEQESKNDAILCRAKYQICSIGEKNRNNRVYEKAVWDKVLADPDITAKLENKSLFFHAEHPTTTQSNTEKVAGVVTDIVLNESENKVYAVMEVLDTPYGRIVDTLLRAGCGIGVSTRADGELEEALDEDGSGYQRVVPESYRFVTIDFTADPSTFGSELPITVERDVTKVIKTGLDDNKIDRQYATVLLEKLYSPEAVALLEALKNDKQHENCKHKMSEKKCGTCPHTNEDTGGGAFEDAEEDDEKKEEKDSEVMDENVEEAFYPRDGKRYDKMGTKRGSKKKGITQAQAVSKQGKPDDDEKEIITCPDCGEEIEKEGDICTNDCSCGKDRTVEEKKYISSSDLCDQPADAKAAQIVVNKSSKKTKKKKKKTKVKESEMIKIAALHEKNIEVKTNQFLIDNWKNFLSHNDAVENIVKVFKIGESNAEKYVACMESTKGNISAVTTRNDEKALPSDIVKDITEMSERLVTITAERDQLVESYGKDIATSTIKIQELNRQLLEHKNSITQKTETLAEEIAKRNDQLETLSESTEKLKASHLLNIKTIQEKKEKESKEIKEKHEKEIKDLKETHKKALISFYVSTKTKGMGLRLPESVLTLLESCKTVEEVDALIRRTQNAIRENIVQSANGLSEIVIESQSDPNPAAADIRKKVGTALKHFGV